MNARSYQDVSYGWLLKSLIVIVAIAGLSLAGSTLLRVWQHAQLYLASLYAFSLFPGPPTIVIYIYTVVIVSSCGLAIVSVLSLADTLFRRPRTRVVAATVLLLILVYLEGFALNPSTPSLPSNSINSTPDEPTANQK